MSGEPSASTRSDVLRLAGMRLYGAEWEADLATKVLAGRPEFKLWSESQFLLLIRGWVGGAAVIPNWIFAALGEQISEQIEDLEDIRDQVGRMLG